jgi:hypothetical protein
MATSPSYARINYSLRPAKHVERKMVFEALRRLDRIADLRQFRYIGLGSPFFADFRLAHREIGIQSLLNIEQETDDQERFEFNRPFGCVEMEFGEASDVLDEIDWEIRTIAWLDYDKPLNTAQIADVKRLAANLKSGSVIVITTNADPFGLEGRVERLQKQLGDYLPLSADDPDLLGGWGTAQLLRSIIHDAIQQQLVIRNEGLPPGAGIHYTQAFNFNYADGVRMLTVGGMLFDAGMVGNAQQLDLDSLPFVRRGEDAYVVEIPHLTWKEMTHLESAFPCDPADAGLDFLDRDAVEQYSAVYRYFPRYANVDL